MANNDSNFGIKTEHMDVSTDRRLPHNERQEIGGGSPAGAARKTSLYLTGLLRASEATLQAEMIALNASPSVPPP
jgi:hypothetical protein